MSMLHTTSKQSEHQIQAQLTTLEVLRRLERAGFRIYAFRCFIGDEPSIALMAKSAFLAPVYAHSPRDLLTCCRRVVGSALQLRSARPARLDATGPRVAFS